MRRYVAHVMGMPISLALRGRHVDDAVAESAWAAAVADLRWVDLVFSTYKPHSWVSRLARGEVTVAECPPQVAEVIALGEQAAAESGGAFSIWLPDQAGVRRFDPTGVVKGWAVDLAARHLRELPSTDFCLSAGGDMLCHTHVPGGEPWRVGIEDPFEPTRLLATVEVSRGGVATSGTTHRGPHLFDGRTGEVALGLASVTVIAPTLVAADIEATTAYALGEEGQSWLEARSNRSGLVVTADGTARPWRGAVRSERLELSLART